MYMCMAANIIICSHLSRSTRFRSWGSLLGPHQPCQPRQQGTSHLMALSMMTSPWRILPLPLTRQFPEPLRATAMTSPYSNMQRQVILSEPILAYKQAPGVLQLCSVCFVVFVISKTQLGLNPNKCMFNCIQHMLSNAWLQVDCKVSHQPNAINVLAVVVPGQAPRRARR